MAHITEAITLRVELDTTKLEELVERMERAISQMAGATSNQAPLPYTAYSKGYTEYSTEHSARVNDLLESLVALSGGDGGAGGDASEDIAQEVQEQLERIGNIDRKIIKSLDDNPKGVCRDREFWQVYTWDNGAKVHHGNYRNKYDAVDHAHEVYAERFNHEEKYYRSIVAWLNLIEGVA